MPSRINAQRGRTFLYVLTTVIVGVATACSDSTGPTGSSAAAIAAVSGNGQTGSLNAAPGAPSVFAVTNAAANPVAKVTVTFSITAGAGTLSPTTAVTDANGTASTNLTPGSAVGAVE